MARLLLKRYSSIKYARSMLPPSLLTCFYPSKRWGVLSKLPLQELALDRYFPEIPAKQVL